MEESTKVSKIFHFNYFNFLVPGIFLFAALLIKSEIPDLKLLYQILLGIGLLGFVLIVLSIQTLIITDNEIGIRRLWKGRIIRLEEIASKKRNTMFHRGAESITWKLFLKNGEKIIITSDPYRKAMRLKEALNWFLRDIPSVNGS